MRSDIADDQQSLHISQRGPVRSTIMRIAPCFFNCRLRSFPSRSCEGRRSWFINKRCRRTRGLDSSAYGGRPAAAGCGLREGGVSRKRTGLWKTRLAGIRLHRVDLPVWTAPPTQVESLKDKQARVGRVQTCVRPRYAGQCRRARMEFEGRIQNTRAC